MTLSPRVWIIVLNYRTPALTLECAASLRETLNAFPHARLMLVDNGSGDESVPILRAFVAQEAARERITVLALPKNGGYACGNNSAMRAALGDANPPDFFWLLNSDTIVRAHALAALVAAMQANPRIGIAGSRLENADGTPQSSAFRFPTIPGEWEANVRWRVMTRVCARWALAPPAPNAPTRAGWVPGASMLIRRAVLEQCGLLDENFFMYFEDVDFCRRAARAGWETWYLAASRVQHRVGASSKLTSAQRHEQRMPRYWFAARRRYFVKHHGVGYAVCADFAWLIGFGLWRVREFLQHKPHGDPPRLWRDFFSYSILRRGARQ
jgi:N-acetylglucosaminyl-diphospho-decaprenol L-rhamnosyltransferase